ncbi:MAG TPA: hypothetical protein VFO94_11455 [Gammaproteobacteria bacterium]|nr:hypothetical protein [Gammaproteobacteria bacterium]
MRSVVGLAALCVIASLGAPARAQAPAGYAVTKSQTVASVPAGYVGRKTTDRETRVGNTPETMGKSATFVMTVGGFVRQCPTADGIVAGDFQYTLASEEVDHGDTMQHAVSLVATLEGHTRDDGMLDRVDVRGTYTRQIHGMPLEQVPVQTSFRIGAQGQPDMTALEDAVRATGNISIATAMWLGSTNYTEAQNFWTQPDKCVEVAFDPPTESRSLGPNGAAEVRVAVRTKEGKTPVSDAQLELQAIQSIGTVAPREGRSEAGMPLNVTYTASSEPRDGHGVSVGVRGSRAGAASGEWKIRAALPYEGTFTQTEHMEITGADAANAPDPRVAALGRSAQRYGVGASSDYEIAGRLVWQLEERSTRAGSFGEVASAFYLPADGEIRVMVKGVGRSLAGRCTYEGEKTFNVRELPPEALRLMLLEIAADGRYNLWLGMVSSFLQFQVEEVCEARVGRRLRQTFDLNDAAIVLGQQQGMVTDDKVSGATQAPIVFGPLHYTGSWEFTKRSR